MWENELLEFQSDLNPPPINLMDQLTPSQDRNFLNKQINLNQEIENPPLSISDPIDEQHQEAITYDLQQMSPLAPAPRSEWTQDEEILFFNFLAQYMMDNSEEFYKWKDKNKKGIFKSMQSKIKSKNKVQCRLKFNSYKRKHSCKKNRYYYEPCMRALIISKLTLYAEIDGQSRQHLENIREQEQKARKINEHINQSQKQLKVIAKLHSQISFSPRDQHEQLPKQVGKMCARRRRKKGFKSIYAVKIEEQENKRSQEEEIKNQTDKGILIQVQDIKKRKRRARLN